VHGGLRVTEYNNITFQTSDFLHSALDQGGHERPNMSSCKSSLLQNGLDSHWIP
jgi:hypothetical protein